MKIKNIQATQILDSNANPTIQITVILENGIISIASVPSGTSTGKYEALELRDNDPNNFQGRSVLKAVENVNTKITQALVGQNVENQKGIDEIMINLDGTENKSNLGANAILSVSLSVARAAAKSQNLELFEYIYVVANSETTTRLPELRSGVSGQEQSLKDHHVFDREAQTESANAREAATNFKIPNPLSVLICGGKHGNWVTDIQEYSIIPNLEKFSNFNSKIQAIIKIYKTLETILEEKKYSTGVGFEGAFCPKELKSNEEALDLIMQAVEKADYKLNEDFTIGVDAAASEFYQNNNYVLKSENNKVVSATEWQQKIIAWANNYPISLLEDIFDQDAWQNWSDLTNAIGNRFIIVGDDLVTTNLKRIQKAIDEKAINSVLIKLNQIGTLTETLEAIKLCQNNNIKTIISHRSGETNDSFIADLAVGTNSDMVKFGAPNRGERIAKYNRLLEIENLLKK